MKPARLPDADDLPVPLDIVAGPGWSAQMVEMAQHIGAYETLMISDRHGGKEFYIPADPEKNPFLDIVGPAKAKVLSWVYRRETIVIPTARYALRLARRGSVLAAVRAGDLTVADAARIMGTRRDYASKLVNQTVEGIGAAPLPRPPRAKDPRQLEMFGQD